MTTDLDALIDRLRDASTGEFNNTATADFLMDAAADALESTLAELRQERERADKGWRTANELNRMHRECHAQRDKAQAALSRAEETIEKVRAVPNEFEWDVPPTAKRILTEYDKQKEAEHG